MDQGDLESIAEAVYKLAGYDEGDVATVTAIAKRLFGREGLRVVPHLREMASLATIEGRRVIAVRRSLPPHLRAFAIGHELAHWMLEREGCSGDEELERACDYIGAAIITPRRAFRSAVRVHGGDWTQLALDFGQTETMMALRYGEVMGNPIAVVAQIVRTRGSAFAWPETPEQFRRLAKLPALPGMKRARLRDDPKRIVLEAEEIFDDVG